VIVLILPEQHSKAKAEAASSIRQMDRNGELLLDVPRVVGFVIDIENFAPFLVVS
jgi:hypothetical protein